MHGRITIRVPVAMADELAAAIGTVPGVLGLEEIPADGATMFPVDSEFAVVEFGTPQGEQFQQWLAEERFLGTGKVLLNVYVASTTAAQLEERLVACRQCVSVPLDIIDRRLLLPRDEVVRSQAHLRGQVVGRGWWVGPPWSTPPADRQPIIIEPGTAFGTGDHPTTRFCLAALERLTDEGFVPRRLLDLGCGSGVLAIAAAQLFPGSELWLSDLDAGCADNANLNFARNGLADHPRHAVWGTAADALLRDRGGCRFDLVLSNIYLDALLQLVEPVADRLRAGGRWVVSGVLEGSQQAEFEARARRRFDIVVGEQLADSGGMTWAGLVLQPRQ